jgi:hypothetical protein
MVVKDVYGNLIADSKSILNRWEILLLSLSNVCGVNDVRQNEMYKGEPLVPVPLRLTKLIPFVWNKEEL